MAQFNEGDVVRIVEVDGINAKWNEFKAKVLNVGEVCSYLEPLSYRPDGWGRTPFDYVNSNLVLVDDEPAIKVLGDVEGLERVAEALLGENWLQELVIRRLNADDGFNLACAVEEVDNVVNAARSGFVGDIGINAHLFQILEAATVPNVKE